MKVKLIFLLCIITNSVFSQKLYLGFGIGPNWTYNQQVGDIPSSVARFNNRISVGEFISVEYSIKKRFALKGTLRNTTYGYNFGLSKSDAPIGVICFTHQIIGFNYINYEIAFKNKVKIISDRLLFTQSIGLVWLPIFIPYPDTDGELGCPGLTPELKYSNEGKKVQNFGINTTIGIEFRLWKLNYLTLDFNYNKGFKEIDFIEATVQDNGNTYSSRISSQGSYGALQLGMKFPFPGNWKKDPSIVNKYYSKPNKDTVKKILPPLYSKGNKVLGISIRPIDKYSGIEVASLFNPFKNPAFSLRYMFFIKNRLAIGGVGYYKRFKLKYSEAIDNELLGGLFTRYYFFNTKSNLFAELNFTAGNYYFLQPAFVLIPSIGFQRSLNNYLSFESCLKLMVPHGAGYPIYHVDPVNVFVDFGINYNF